MRARFIKVDGINTRYLSAGTGRALLLIHGVGLSADCFIRNIDILGGHFAVYAPDLLGHGFTDAIDYDGAPPQIHMAHHVVRLAAALGLDHYSLAGSSFGALVAALAYFEQPERVESLILIGSGSVFHGSDEQRKTLLAAAANAKQAMADPTLESCRRRIANIVHDAATVCEEMLPVQLTSYALPDRRLAYQATIDGSIAAMDRPGARVLDRLEEIGVPTRVIVGRDDVRASWTLHRDGVERMPTAELTVYDKCGHLPFMEYADRFNREVIAFIDRTGGRTDR